MKLYFTNGSISYTDSNGNSQNVPVPNGVVTLNSTSVKTGASTSYDSATSRWSTNVASGSLTGNTFVTGLAFTVPAYFPTGIQNVTFSGAFSTDTPGISLQWQWNASVYTSFSTTAPSPYATSTNNNVLGVNPEDGSANKYGSDLAGTPENFKRYTTFGATGGYFSVATGVTPSVAQVSVSPSSLDFGTRRRVSPALR